MNVTVDYGDRSLAVPLPPGVEGEVIVPSYPPPAADATEAVRLSFEQPIDSPSLASLARAKGSAVIVVPDGTRPLPLPVVLSPLLETIAREIPPERITILFATGMHRPVEAEEARRLLGDGIFRRHAWRSHHPEDVETIGRTERGTPIALSRTYLAHELRIVVGLVEPHILAGFSGGRKLIAPGVVSIGSMPILHGPDIIGHEKARIGILDENPFHQEALAIARAAKVDFAVNVILAEGRRVAGVFGGDVDRSHRRACDELVRYVRRTTGTRYDLVVSSGGGAPLDKTFYQSVKGIATSLPITKRGGTVLLAASCSEGWGSGPFTTLLEQATDLESFLRWAKEPGAFLRDQWMVQHLREAEEDVSVLVYSESLDRDRALAYGVAAVDSMEEGIAAALEGIDHPSVAILPRGPYTWAQARA
jgi:nickel-dependent lactate racemase